MRYGWNVMLPERAFRTFLGKLVTLEGGSDPTPPDYTPMANASKEATAAGLALGNRQMDMAQQQYDQNRATLAPVIAGNIAAQQQQLSQGLQTFNETDPSRQINAATAQNFSTAGAQEGFASQAAADMQSQQANQEAQQQRAQSAMGVNPNSGRAQALSGIMRVQNAANRAGAQTGARVQAQGLGFNMNSAVAGMGGISSAMYAGGTQSGGQAAGTLNGLTSNLQSGTSAGAGTVLQGQQIGVQGMGSVLNAQTNQYNAQLQANATGNAGTGALFGTLAMAGAVAY